MAQKLTTAWISLPKPTRKWWWWPSLMKEFIYGNAATAEYFVLNQPLRPKFGQCHYNLIVGIEQSAFYKLVNTQPIPLNSYGDRHRHGENRDQPQQSPGIFAGSPAVPEHHHDGSTPFSSSCDEEYTRARLIPLIGL